MPEKRRLTKMQYDRKYNVLFPIFQMKNIYRVYGFWNLLDKPRSCIFDLIFYAPNVANLGFWKKVLTIALWYQQLHYSTDNM